MNESQFLETLQLKARTQARINSSSPLPEWVKPFASVVGLHYWQFLLIVSCIAAGWISIWFFPGVYAEVTKNIL